MGQDTARSWSMLVAAKLKNPRPQTKKKERKKP